MAEVRRAERGDVPQLIPLMLAYIVDFYRQPTPPEEDLRALIDVLLERKDGLQLVAEHDGTLIGFATLYFTWSTLRPGRRTVMNDLYVAEGSRGTDAATRLFEACREESRLLGANEMNWETAPDNRRAQAFYAKVGGRREEWLTYAIAP
jgi:GNAT superfamily N-acetyltransferase